MANGTTTTSTSTSPDLKKTREVTELEVQLPDPEEILRQELSVYAMLTFWYKLKPGEIVEMPLNILRSYVEELPAILADYQHMMIIAASFPNMKEADQKKIMRQLDNARAGRSSKEVEEFELSEAQRHHKAMKMGFSFEAVPVDENGEVVVQTPPPVLGQVSEEEPDVS